VASPGRVTYVRNSGGLATVLLVRFLSFFSGAAFLIAWFDGASSLRAF